MLSGDIRVNQSMVSSRHNVKGCCVHMHYFGCCRDWRLSCFYLHCPLGTPGCLHRNIFINHSENVFDNVKNMLKRAESLAIDSVTEKCGKLSRMWWGAAQKVAEANQTLGSMQRTKR